MRKLFGAALLACLVAVPAAQAAAEVRIDVLSNRADLISAGDALVEVALPEGADPGAVTVTAAGRDVTDAFSVTADARFIGLVEGLDDGENVVTATLAGGSGARITIVNHPNGGPVFSGPQVQPWVCQETAVDEQCNEPVSYEFQYKNTNGEFAAYDPENPPSDVATTTTDEGNTVPYIVRIETGYQDRDQYRIAVLYDPEEPFTATRHASSAAPKSFLTSLASLFERRETPCPRSLVRNRTGLRGGAQPVSAQGRRSPLRPTTHQ